MSRLGLAVRAFWKVLTDAAVADRVGPALDPPTTGPDLRVLAVLQRDGRLVDFLKEDIDGFADAQVGAAVRDIHRDCRRAIGQYLAIEPVLGEAEGAAVVVPADFDPSRIRLVGNVAGSPPFKGVLRHHGWRVASVQLPTTLAGAGDGTVLAPAEVEIP